MEVTTYLSAYRTPSRSGSQYVQRYKQGDFPMAATPNPKKKPSCHHNLADKQDSDSVNFGKPDEDKKTQPSMTISKIMPIILVLGIISSVLGGVAVIFRDFDGLFEMDLTLRGGRMLIDGRKPASLPPITDNTADSK
jgi:hypothetical protein